jgi:hypothetical protein
MKKILLIVSLGAILLTACSKTETTTNSTNSAGNNAKNTGTAQATPTIDPNTPVTFPFKDFPAVETTAKEGDVVLVPSYEWLQEATVKGGDDKSRCTPVPITSSAKEGEKVKAGWVGSFKESTVTKVDPKIGRVFIKFDVDSKEKAVAFGDVMK